VLGLTDRVADELSLMAVDFDLSAIGRITDELGTILGVPADETPELVDLGPEHSEALSRFFVRNDVPEVTGGFDPFPLTEEQAVRIATEPRQDRYYAAVAGDEIVGMAMLRGWDEGYEVPSFGVVVDAARHGRGIGARLTDHAIEQARALGSPGVRLSVYGTNHVAQRMYVARGFVEQAREPVERASGPDERVVMVKDLSEPETS
jgi:ribosomal protein S18 acetylase RimI-like enzyme